MVIVEDLNPTSREQETAEADIKKEEEGAQKQAN